MEHKQGHSKSSAKDVFSYLFMIVLLTWGVISFSALLWQYINFSFPDVLQFSYQSITDIARNSMAGLIVTWPVFVLVSWVISKDLKANPSKTEIWVRKWLLYLTLFVCAIVSIVDLVMLLNNFLSGEVTARFILKALTVLLVAIAVFAYYLWELRRDASKKEHIQLTAAVLSSIAMLIAIISGFFIIGTPAHQRAIRLDEQRVNELMGIQGQVVNYWQQKEVLPATTAQLNDTINGYVVPADPITKAAYEYTVKGPLSFELCATFEEASLPNGASTQYESMYYSPMGTTESWTHESGRACFERTIDPELYSLEKAQNIKY